MSARQPPPDGARPTSIEEAAERLAAIVRAAEEAAATVIDDAEAEAERRLEAARARADRVVAERLRELADQLDPALGGGEEAAAPVRLHPVRDAGEVEPGRRASAAGARLLATQMAVSGARREEIAVRLREGFELDDVEEILDAILGGEG